MTQHDMNPVEIDASALDEVTGGAKYRVASGALRTMIESIKGRDGKAIVDFLSWQTAATASKVRPWAGGAIDKLPEVQHYYKFGR